MSPKELCSGSEGNSGYEECIVAYLPTVQDSVGPYQKLNRVLASRKSELCSAARTLQLSSPSSLSLELVAALCCWFISHHRRASILPLWAVDCSYSPPIQCSAPELKSAVCVQALHLCCAACLQSLALDTQ